MEILMINVANWVGYHITNRLLEEDYKVAGHVTDSESEHLLDFFRRNSNFSLLEKLESRTFPVAICVGELPKLVGIKIDLLFLINGKTDREITENAVSIKTNCLFGEWMPMTEESFLQNGDLLSFSSPEFLEHGLYIDDFLDHFMHRLEKKSYEKEIVIRPARVKSGEKLEKIQFVKENKPIEERLEQVISHYNRYKELYPAIDEKEK